MTSIAETAWAEIFARLTATAFPGVTRIRRARRTDVGRDDCPAIHLIEGIAKPTETKRCDWRWEMEGTIAVFVRDDLGLAAADPFVIEVVKRIKPEPTTYTNRVLMELLRIGPNTEPADKDATRVDIDFQLRFGTGRWSLDTPA